MDYEARVVKLRRAQHHAPSYSGRSTGCSLGATGGRALPLQRGGRRARPPGRRRGNGARRRLGCPGSAQLAAGGSALSALDWMPEVVAAVVAGCPAAALRLRLLEG